MFFRPSGVGLSTVRKIFMTNAHLNLVYSFNDNKKTTSRWSRWCDYFFVDQETFMKNINDGNLLGMQSLLVIIMEHQDYVDKLRDEGKMSF